MFITFEGPDGSGKSSQISLLSDHLTALGFDVVATREPGGTLIGDQIRSTLHDVANVEMVPVAELLLYCASRAQLVDQVIRPALLNGKVVISDRYSDSSVAYQGYGRELDLAQVRATTSLATGGLVPDLSLLLDIDADRGLSRRVVGGDEMNRLDLEQISFHKRVRKGYLEMAKKEPERWVVINGDQPEEAVQADIRQVVLPKLQR